MERHRARRREWHQARLYCGDDLEAAATNAARGGRDVEQHDDDDDSAREAMRWTPGVRVPMKRRQLSTGSRLR